MARAPFQVLVIPFLIQDQEIQFGLFRRNAATGGYWQGIAGGGEDRETPLEAARREAFEEAGITPDARFIALESLAMIPVVNVCGFQWGPDVPLLTEYAFGVQVERRELILSPEHTEFSWQPLDTAMKMVHWDSNRTALWELHYRLRNNCARVA